MHYKKSFLEKLADLLVYIVLIAAAMTCVFPIIHILAVSFSSAGPAAAGQVGIWPVNPVLDAYKLIGQRMEFWRSFGVSLKRVAVGIIFNTLITLLCAYPLSRRASRFPQRKYYVAGLLTAMLFSGGLIPTYMVVVRTGLMGSFWSLIIPGAVPIFNIIVLLNFFRDIPDEIEEAAFLDGAGHWTILARIYVPLSTAAMATVTLFVIINHWNSWFDGMIYINRPEGYPLQTYMRTILISQDMNTRLTIEEIIARANTSERTIKAAQVFLGCVPVLLVYPFLQRYFTKGLVLGSVKG
jgi:putative aldouronate transport system permease protein